MTNIINNLAQAQSSKEAYHAQVWLEWLKVLGPYFCACFSAWLAYRAAVRHNKSDRRRQFIRFIREWRADIYAPTAGDSNELYGRAYLAKVNVFQGEIESVRDIYSGDERFEPLTARIWNRKKNEGSDDDPRPEILKDIDALLEIL